MNKTSKSKKWSFLVYIAGDNNLSDAGLEDIREMCAEGASGDVHVGVEIDTYGEHTGSIRYEITEPDWSGTAYRMVIERLQEKDSGDPHTLISFLDWGLGRYPSEMKVVVVWNHGAGFRRPRRDIGYDDFGSSLDMPEIEYAFEKAGIGPDNKIDVLGFDACLMNMVEITHHFADQVVLVVGSQETEPGDGWPYDRVLHQIKRATDGNDLGKRIVDVYIRDYINRGVGNVTQSAVSTAACSRVVKGMDELGTLFADDIDAHRQALRSIRIRLQSFEYADYVDVVHLCDLVHDEIGDEDIKKACNRLRNACRKAVVASDRFGFGVDNAHGLSCWFPSDQYTFYNNRAKYLRLKCNHGGYFGWLRFLDHFHQ